VTGALSRALARRGHDVHVVLPLYRSVNRAKLGVRDAGFAVDAWFPDGVQRVRVHEVPHRAGEPRWWLLEHPWYDRAELYGEAGGAYGDNHLRFGLLCRAAVEVAALRAPAPDVMHLHDWQAGLVAADLRATRGIDPRFADTRLVFTVHNLAYAGVFHPDMALGGLGLPARLYNLHALEFFDRVSLLKAGLVYADALTTVSPRYAQEIRTAEHGCGLDGLLRARADRLHGIVNGIDTDEWNPAADPALPAPFDADHLEGKALCKAELQRELGLQPSARAPLLGVVARLAWQKGIDLVADTAERLVHEGMQLAILGAGEPGLESRLAVLAARNPGRIAVRLGFDVPLSHRIEAGSDLFLMPSRYEPCGLNQMYSLRYGTVPVVRAVGGLDDTVEEFDETLGTGTGFKFVPPTATALAEETGKAASVHAHPEVWQPLMRRGMTRDLSWDRSAATYEQLFHALVAERRVTPV
jgi:starch synthase